MVGASGAPHLLQRPVFGSQDCWNREILASPWREAVEGVAVFEPPTKGKGREAGGQSCHAEGPEQAGGMGQQEPHDVEQCEVVHVGQPSLHVGLCSLGLAGQQLCRKGPGLPVDNKHELAVHLRGNEGKLGCIGKL